MRASGLALALLALASRSAATEWLPGPEQAVAASVVQRGYAEPRLASRTVVEESGRWWNNTARHSGAGAVLGYITPWNGGGYAAALRWRAKFSHLAPCWHQILERDGAPAIQGTPGAEGDAFIAELRSPSGAGGGAPSPLLYPRFSLELRNPAAALRNPAPLAAALAAAVLARGYDGAVLDGFATLAGVASLAKLPASALAALARALAAALAALPPAAAAAGGPPRPRGLVLAVPPGFPPDAVAQLLAPPSSAAAGHPVELLSLMTYDAQFSAGGGAAGPNAPLPWLAGAMDATLGPAAARGGGTCAAGEDDEKAEPCAVTAPSSRALLLGLNFYGWRFLAGGAGGQPQAVLGRDVVRLLAASRAPLVWAASSGEHHFAQPGDDALPPSSVFYPTPAAVAARVRLARSLGVGLAVWELGQGLPWLFDLL